MQTAKTCGNWVSFCGTLVSLNNPPWSIAIDSCHDAIECPFSLPPLPSPLPVHFPQPRYRPISSMDYKSCGEGLRQHQFMWQNVSVLGFCTDGQNSADLNWYTSIDFSRGTQNNTSWGSDATLLHDRAALVWLIPYLYATLLCLNEHHLPRFLWRFAGTYNEEWCYHIAAFSFCITLQPILQF